MRSQKCAVHGRASSTFLALIECLPRFPLQALSRPSDRAYCSGVVEPKAQSGRGRGAKASSRTPTRHAGGIVFSPPHEAKNNQARRECTHAAGSLQHFIRLSFRRSRQAFVTASAEKPSIAVADSAAPCGKGSVDRCAWVGRRNHAVELLEPRGRERAGDGRRYWCAATFCTAPADTSGVPERKRRAIRMHHLTTQCWLRLRRAGSKSDCTSRCKRPGPWTTLHHFRFRMSLSRIFFLGFFFWPTGETGFGWQMDESEDGEGGMKLPTAGVRCRQCDALWLQAKTTPVWQRGNREVRE